MGKPGAEAARADMTQQEGPIIDRAVAYATAPLIGQNKELVADIYLPRGGEGPFPVLVWFHSGAFRGGKYNSRNHGLMARWLTASGIAVITPEYRLGATKADLSDGVRARLNDLRQIRVEGFRWDLSQARSLAALEDSLRFLTWLETRREDLGLGGKVVLGGSSAGAINAFNICFTAPYLGLSCPEIGGILSYSGGLAYPSLYRPGALPVFTAHNPDDPRVSIDTIRMLKEMDPDLQLMEVPEQPHGSLKLYERERKYETYQRMIDLITHMSGLNAGKGASA